MHPIRLLSTAGVVLTLGLAGCGGKAADNGVASAGSQPAAAASASAAVADEDRPVKFAQCMREQGMDWFPDPKKGQGLIIKVPKGQDQGEFHAAMKACKKYSPMGGDAAKVDPAVIEQMRQMAKCMRENGVPKFPDPKANGQMEVDHGKLGMGPDDPIFKAAEQTCARFRPSGPPNKTGEGDGGNVISGNSEQK